MLELRVNKELCRGCLTHDCLARCQYLHLDSKQAGAEIEKRMRPGRRFWRLPVLLA